MTERDYLPTEFEMMRKEEKLEKLPEEYRGYEFVRDELFPPPQGDPAED